MRLRKKYLFYLLAIISAFALSAETAVDSIISHDFIDDPWVLGLSFFMIATLVTFLIAALLSFPVHKRSLGSFIDPSFVRLRLIKKEELLYHLVAGTGNAVLTLGYFFVVSRVLDPSVILSFAQLSILYLLAVESVAEKNTPTLADIQSSLIVTFGAILGSIGLSGDIDLESLMVVFLI